jgi:hypothetical protein
MNNDDFRPPVVLMVVGSLPLSFRQWTVVCVNVFFFFWGGEGAPLQCLYLPFCPYWLVCIISNPRGKHTRAHTTKQKKEENTGEVRAVVVWSTSLEVHTHI